MLYELLDSHPIVRNADPTVNFEDKYILKFYKRIKSYAGRVDGELTLNIPRDLRPLVINTIIVLYSPKVYFFKNC